MLNQLFKTAFVNIIALLLAISVAHGQTLPLDRNILKAYNKHTRAANGLPGKSYWQNQGNYDINVRFDPATRKVTGSVHIRYLNNSPDTLKSLSFKLYPNLYKSNSMRNVPVATADLQQGMHLTEMEIDGQKIDSTKRVARGTNLSIKALTILPKSTTSITIDYDYILNKGSFYRTGQIDEGSFFLAYFFPRLAVYDDVDGWNEYPYLGKEEFYNDYGDFKVSITVPQNYCVWATGDLTNKNEVYEQPIADRIERAEQNDAIIDIITRADLDGGHITKNGSELTWKFDARQVTDFAFAVSRNYIWKASSVLVDHVTKRRTRVDAVYNPLHTDYLPVINYNRKAVEIISNIFPAIPFPYPHETIVDGLDAMEYPMMVNNLPFEDPKDIVEFTAHEVFHTIFPFYVGTNETKYSFMDEGWATMTEFMFHQLIAPEVPLHYDISSVNDYAGLAEDVPIMTPTAQLYGSARFADKDLKPALALWYIRDLVGENKFAEATRFYIRTWAGKHPTPYDFFNCMNKGLGVDLNWYWQKWYFEKAVPDLAIAKVQKINKKYLITIANLGGAPVPIHLNISYADGSMQVVSKKISTWKTGNQITIAIMAKSKIVKVTLGDPLDADTQPDNNIWKPIAAMN